MFLYVIRDLVADESGPVFEAKNDGIAQRAYLQLVQKNSVNPSEFRLLCIGEINKESDHITACEPINIDMAIDRELAVFNE